MKDSTIDKIGHHVVVGLTSVSGLVIGSYISKAGTIVGTGLGASASSVTGELYLSLFGRGRSTFTALPIRAKRGIATLAAVGVAIPLAVTGVEAATNKPLHAVVTGQNVHGGTSFVGGSTKPGPAPTSTTPAIVPSPVASPSDTRTLQSLRPSGLASPSQPVASPQSTAPPLPSASPGYPSTAAPAPSATAPAA